MRMGFGGGIILGVAVGAMVSIMAEENFRMDRSWRAMNKAGKNISRKAERAYSSIRHMI